MSARFDVLFAGQLLEGRDAATVRANLGRLFKADEATLDKLFSGKAQILKRDADAATARKYQQALEKAGARPVLRPCDEATATPAVAATAPHAGLVLAPPGTDVLGPDERAPAIASSISAPTLDVAAAGERLAEPAPPAPPAPDTSHLTLGEAGENIPGLSRPAPVAVTISDGLALEPEGGDLSDCAMPPAPAPAVDLSHLELAAAGADVLEEQYRKRETAAAPDTSRLTLEE
ncbi:hypothetical protein Q6D67_03275 [Haliea sp. E1-2-M8]|uniref:hypothetical protein n=1 Tax=Haliea sp. E1-2-M8 TaxID=3064706 RepID=UPI0027156B72|nr:hypothetical protein [Haliea sp. E1-2-M8]MDO8860712.1 hypothetical protein [Haliea sp. E1-2-M8]